MALGDPPHAAAAPVFTPRAIERMRALLREQGRSDLALRVYVVTGGCLGFLYKMAWDVPGEDDDVVSFGEVRVIVDRQSARRLGGLRVDYKNLLHGGAFAITNPTASATCRCGRSFSVEGDPGVPQICDLELAEPEA